MSRQRKPVAKEIKMEKRETTEAVVKAVTEGVKVGAEKASDTIKAKIEERIKFYRDKGAFDHANALREALEIMESVEGGK